MQLFRNKTNTSKANDVFDMIFSNTNIYNSYALVITDDSKKFLAINDEFIKVFKYQREDLIGQHTDIINSETHQLSFYEKLWDSIQNGKTYSNYINTKTKDGVVINSRIKIIPITSKDKNTKYLCIYDPIGEETSFKLDVVESYKVLLDLAQKIPDIVCIKDGEGKWLLANEADLRLFQLEGVDYKGKTDADLAPFTHEMYKNAFLECMETDEKCWENGRLTRSDEVIPIPNGNEIVLDVLKIPIFYADGQRKNLIVVGRDVTEHRKSEKNLKEALVKAEESDRLKSTFLATMSHELRTPLNSILGFSSLIFDENELDEIYDYSRIINNNGNMLLKLIEDLFDISLIESEQIQIIKQEVDVVKSIAEIYEAFPVEISALNKIHIQFSFHTDIGELWVSTDGFRIKQILTNLLRNALKFTEEGSIIIHLAKNENDFVMKVIDTGIGIQKEKISDLFNAFSQGEAGRNRKFGGAGLGLAISKKLATLLGGDLSATSEVGKGSEFSLRIPLS